MFNRLFKKMDELFTSLDKDMEEVEEIRETETRPDGTIIIRRITVRKTIKIEK